MKNIVPVIMAGILGIYGLIVAAILVGKSASRRRRPRPRAARPPRSLALLPRAPRASAALPLPVDPPAGGLNAYSSFAGFAHLAAGLACGLSSLAAGLAIGVVGDAGVRAIGQQPGLYVGMILILIFGEALGLYGLIVALILSQKTAPTGTCGGPNN